jgi:hypothetical protein
LQRLSYRRVRTPAHAIRKGVQDRWLHPNRRRRAALADSIGRVRAQLLHQTNTSQPQPAAPDFGRNNNFALDQVSLFFAGRVTDYAGAFVQGTYDGVGHAFSLDNTDLRLTTPLDVKGNELGVGLSVNNGPTVDLAHHDRDMGRLLGIDGKAITIGDLWALSPGNDGKAGSSGEIYFTAGVKDEAQGLFGSLSAVPGTDRFMVSGTPPHAPG